MKYSFVISGAAETGICAPDAHLKAEKMGQEVIEHNGILFTGATTGIPFWAAKGAKEAGGISIGISPAASLASHIKTYRLPTEHFDYIMFTGFEYSGRNLLLTRIADAVIVICGRMGTLNEFTVAFEDQKPIGVLTGTGGMAEEIEHIVEKSHRKHGKIVYDANPKSLIEKLIELIDKDRKELPLLPGDGKE